MAIITFTVSLQVAGEDQGVGQVAEPQLAAQRQAGPESGRGQASGEQERIQNAEQHQEKAGEPTRPVDANKQVSQHRNQPGASGHSSTKGHNSSPSGSKNKPRKSGR